MDELIHRIELPVRSNVINWGTMLKDSGTENFERQSTNTGVSGIDVIQRIISQYG